jgi:hypothetical protein
VHHESLGAFVTRRVNSGGEGATISYALIEAAKLNGLNPEAYLADIVYHSAGAYTSVLTGSDQSPRSKRKPLAWCAIMEREHRLINFSTS